MAGALAVSSLTSHDRLPGSVRELALMASGAEALPDPSR